MKENTIKKRNIDIKYTQIILANKICKEYKEMV